MKQILTGIVLLLLLIGCSKKEELNYTVKEINGHKVYKNKNIPANKNLRIKTKELFSIKAYDDEFAGDSLRTMTDITSVDLDSKGNIYILSMKTASVKKFDKDGIFIKSFGKMGAGPGETRWPQGMYIQNDTINVLNQMVLQMVKYDTDGNFLRNASTKECKMPVYTKRVGNNKLITYLCNWRKEDDGRYMDYDLGLITSGYDVIKRIKKQSYTAKEVQGYVNLRFGNAATEKELYIASNSDSEYLIDVFNFDGNKSYSISKPFRKIKASEEVVKATKNRKKFQTAITDLYADNGDRIWANVAFEGNETNGDDTLIDIFEKGIFLNRVKLDFTNEYIQFLNGNRLYTIDYENLALKVYEYSVVSSKI